ncbi:DUF1918 domain-containing protein [Pseudonocardia abyssalis]|uniref:DUF1918 domain-containing protein n=1 Tax=Pseudonocardia abyssalis TaxID=2792008 RepID=A0ABS6UPR4_9PSEU|nr:DUF1918 domain-containing protein [Pseudonocardia abyssalis]MBW0116582.1 DUF1918 domain-containing protein [Pseudonocardia abyssalis]MBW0133784.1 DUF1918 domain-containing protein [Pseudonocardia abyssalis]
MRAHVGDWLVVPVAPGDHLVRRGRIVGVPHEDGSPPYRVRWLDDDHESLLFPPPDARLQCPSRKGGGHDAATAEAR